MHLNYVYESYSYFTYLFELKIIPKDNLIVATVFTISIFYPEQFNSYRCLF